MTLAHASDIRILVVDDEADLRLLISRRLKKSGGYTVVGEAENVAEAVEIATRERPDVILLDLLLRSEHGRDAIGPLMRAAPGAMIAVLTALPAEHEEDSARNAGAFTFYEKAMVADLAGHIVADLELFRRALDGEDVIAPSAVGRRPAS